MEFVVQGKDDDGWHHRGSRLYFGKAGQAKYVRRQRGGNGAEIIPLILVRDADRGGLVFFN